MPKRTATPADAAATAARLRAYCAALPPAARATLIRLRDSIRAAAPDAELAFSYGIPAFRLGGKMLVWFAAWRAHTRLYPLTPGMRRGNAETLRGYAVARGTVRFPLDRPLPVELVRKLVRARAAEMRAAASDRRATPRGSATGAKRGSAKVGVAGAKRRAGARARATVSTSRAGARLRRPAAKRGRSGRVA